MRAQNTITGAGVSQHSDSREAETAESEHSVYSARARIQNLGNIS